MFFKKQILFSKVCSLLLIQFLISNSALACPINRKEERTTLAPRLLLPTGILRKESLYTMPALSPKTAVLFDNFLDASERLGLSKTQISYLVAHFANDTELMKSFIYLSRQMKKEKVSSYIAWGAVKDTSLRSVAINYAYYLKRLITDFDQAGEKLSVDPYLVERCKSLLINTIFKDEYDFAKIDKMVRDKLPQRIVRFAFLAYETYDYDSIQEELFSLGRDMDTHTIGELVISLFDDGMHFSPVTQPEFSPESTPDIRWQDFKQEVSRSTNLTMDWNKARFISRSLIVPISGTENNLVIKFARTGQMPNELLDEQFWNFYLRLRYPGRFNALPKPVKIKDSFIFGLADFPSQKPQKLKLHNRGYAIAFIVQKDYNLKTINDPHVYSGEEFTSGLDITSAQLGFLASGAIFHQDIIPLFHNRQAGRERLDNGAYDPTVNPPGRLDRWLNSTDWPNWWTGGIRDAEHLTQGTSLPLETYYSATTSALLGLHLSLGSYFRNNDRTRTGLTASGQAHDTRDLFEPELFRKALETVYRSYAAGLGLRLKFMPYDLGHLTARMIEKMGLDTDMEEMLRFNIHNRMSNEEFIRFFLERGYTLPEIEEKFLPQKGMDIDISLVSGPHLGGFNQENSLPEMVDSIRIFSLMCSIYIYKTNIRQDNFPQIRQSSYRLPQSELLRNLEIEQAI